MRTSVAILPSPVNSVATHSRIELEKLILDGGTQTRAAINNATVEEYAERMAEGERFPPIRVFTDGLKFLLSRGFHRVLAAKHAGFVTFEAEIFKGTVEDALIDSAADNRAHGLRRTNADKRFCVDLFLERFPRWSDRRISETCGVSHNFVSEMRGRLSSDDSESTMRVGRDGRLIDTTNIGRYARTTSSPAESESERDDRDPAHNHRTVGTGNNEWYTPSQYVEAVRRVLGCIDLDPASSELAQRTVRASRYFTLGDDGLTMDWYGRVFVNPPYSQPQIYQFIEKLVREFDANRVTEAVALTHNYTDTRWWHLAGTACQAICFTARRIAFVDTIGNRASPTQGQTFFYFGSRVDRFRQEFRETGLVLGGGAS